jgi:hypothetical protein
MFAMRMPTIICLASVLLAPCGASAQQYVPPGGSQFNPPLPPPLPPPRIEVPAIPQMDAPPSQPSIAVSPRGSFSDRISTCLDQAAAAGLDPAERAAYSRACANR